MDQRCALSSCWFDRLPPELLAAIVACLPLQDRLPLATISKRWLAAVRAAGAPGVALELRARSRAVPAVLLAASPVNTLALVTPGACTALPAAAAASQVGRWDPQEQQLWQPAAGRGRARPAAAAWHLRRGLASAAGAGAARRRPLTLLLAAPEWDTSAAEVQRMLQAAAAEQLIGRVAMPLGLLRLDGALAAVLVRCNTRAASLPSGLQAPTCYARLEQLALQLSPSDDLPACLACLHPGMLPALRCLALLAPPGEGVAADLSSLRHRGITRLDLRGIQLPAGFASLQHLTGLRELAVRYDEEEEVPPLNLHGDVSALSSLRQLASLSLDGLASGEGLSALPHLTALSISPAQGARIRLHGLPRLRRLVCDLGSSGSSGRELLSERASVHVPAAGHGLDSLAQLELRCFVWRHWEAEGSEGGGSDDGGSAGGSSGSGSSEGDDAGSGVGSEAASGSEWDEGQHEEEEEEEEEEDEASSGSSGSGDSEAGSSEAGSEAAAGMALDGWEEEEDEEAGEGGGAAADGEEEGWQEEEQAAGLLEASWGFMQHAQGGSGGTTSAQGVPAIVSLEQWYLAALLARLPTLASIQLTDYMGLVDPPALLEAADPQAAAKPGLPGIAGLAAAAAKDAAVPSRAGTPGLGAGAAAGGGEGAAASSLAGWRREVAETPVPGGISQWDLSFARCSC
ncbi:calcium-binding hemolysin [Chlorella sorokiniana]|uniref:Calcium-binding hemolysin n=1 Tax=Chlorella sorokiniana TaxID=3076 RepID=A0A2P6TIA0_CHLSO|nr:calcium-binding hemolysin [Chlorella sorokiniana]|eukprot:PRW34007.1 calcium-binding hemolysin [Chlorella sorokiniana]